MPKKKSITKSSQVLPPTADQVEGTGNEQEHSGAMPLTKAMLSAAYLHEMSATAFSERLKRMRQAKGLTLDALSFVTKGVDPEGKGISRVSLSRYETGTSPGLRELRLLSQALRQTLAWLVYGDDEDPMKPSASIMTFEDEIARVVVEVLASKGLAEREVSAREDADYWRLLEEAKKLSK